MAEFGRAKLKFLKRFLKLRHGVPSHDTFSTVFRMRQRRNKRCGQPAKRGIEGLRIERRAA